jgi:hypothetical protein
MRTDYPIGECRDATCQAPIIWAVTAGRGKRMPVDANPTPDGNVMLTLADGSDTPVATVIDPAAPPLGGWPGTLHHSHFETCPAADRWRARPRKH